MPNTPIEPVVDLLDRLISDAFSAQQRTAEMGTLQRENLIRVLRQTLARLEQPRPRSESD